jgi:hypothetical protein
MRSEPKEFAQVYAVIKMTLEKLALVGVINVDMQEQATLLTKSVGQEISAMINHQAALGKRFEELIAQQHQLRRDGIKTKQNVSGAAQPGVHRACACTSGGRADSPLPVPLQFEQLLLDPLYGPRSLLKINPPAPSRSPGQGRFSAVRSPLCRRLCFSIMMLKRVAGERVRHQARCRAAPRQHRSALRQAQGQPKRRREHGQGQQRAAAATDALAQQPRRACGHTPAWGHP